MIPIESITAAKVQDVVTVAIVIPATEYDEAFLMTGGDEPHACFLSGNYRFHAILASEGENWKGAVVHHVRIEVDYESIYSIASQEKKTGSIIFGADGAYIVCRFRSGGFLDSKLIPLGHSASSFGDSFDAVGFLHWRVQLTVGLRDVTLFDSRSSIQDD